LTSVLSIRRAVTLSFLVAWILVGISGYILLSSPLLAKAGLRLPMNIVIDIHVYSGFTALGISALHIALNYDALKSYLGSTFRSSGQIQRAKSRTKH